MRFITLMRRWNWTPLLSVLAAWLSFAMSGFFFYLAKLSFNNGGGWAGFWGGCCVTIGIVYAIKWKELTS